MDLYEAILFRKPVKEYRMEPLSPVFLENLEHYTHSLSPLLEGQQVFYSVFEHDGDKKTDLLFHERAPYYLAVYAGCDTAEQVNAGYQLAQIALYLASREIGSQIIPVAPLLRFHTEKSFAETLVHYRICSEGADCGKRLPSLLLAFGKPERLEKKEEKIFPSLSEQICTCKEEISPVLERILAMGCMAPSVHHNNPWRFVAYQNRIHVFCKMGRNLRPVCKKQQYFDIGMSVAYLSLAAEMEWYQTEVSIKEEIAEKNFRQNEYILTIQFSQMG